MKFIEFEAKEILRGFGYFKGIHTKEPIKVPIKLNLTWNSDLLSFINPIHIGFLRAYVDGTIQIDDEEFTLFGTLTLKYFEDNSIEYHLFIENFIKKSSTKDSECLTFIGKKINIKPWNLLFSHTTCFGTLLQNNELIADCYLFFNLKDLFPFLKSFKFKFNV
ncbi:hypothetical protein M0R19_03180 [Candidatus Pacearchaeota archaeon]|nr:hypothetical protein [Candidatus Pacearchaeota archaeon]